MELVKAFEAKTPLSLNEKVEDAKGNKTFKEIGIVQLPVPLVTDFGIEAAPQMKDGVAVTEDGLPLYESDVYNWLQSAIVNQVKAQSRNKFVKGELKADAKIASNFEELIAVGERSGQALKDRAECKRSFVAYLEAQNKKAVVVKILGDLFGDKNSIITAKDTYVESLSMHVPAWIATLKEEEKVRFTRTIEGIQESLDSRDVNAEDFK